LSNGIYPEALGVVVQGTTSGELVTAKILDGEYAGKEWMVPGGDYVVVGG
jgi:hypothetical protein